MNFKKGASTVEFTICLLVLFIILCGFLDFLFWGIRGVHLNTYTNALAREVSIQGGILGLNEDSANDTANVNKIEKKVENLAQFLNCNELIFTIQLSGIELYEEDSNDNNIRPSKTHTHIVRCKRNGSDYVITWDNKPTGDELIQYGGQIRVSYEAYGDSLMNVLGMRLRNRNSYYAISLKRSSNI